MGNFYLGGVKMKLVLDTNIVYHITNISKNNEIDDENLMKLIQLNECIFPSAVVYESFIRYYHDKEKLGEIISAIFEIGNSRFLNVKGMDFEESPIIYDPDKQIAKMKFSYDELITKRIEGEITYTMLYYYSILSFFIFTILIKEKKNSPQRIYLDHIAAHHLEVELSNDKTNIFKEKLEIAYRGKNTEKDYLDILEKMITESCIEFIEKLLSFELMSKSGDTSKEEMNNEKNESKLYKRFSSENFKLYEYLSKKPQISKKDYQIFCKEYLDKSSLNDSTKFSPTAYQYIKYKLEKAFLSGSKIRKNDINDMLILSSHDIFDCNVVTCDKKMIEFIKNNLVQNSEFTKLYYKK